MAFATKSSAVNVLVGMVLGSGSPSEVSGVDASLMPLAAIMGRLMERSRWLSMREETHNGGSGLLAAIVSDNAGSVAAFRIRPCEAAVIFIVDVGK